MELLCFAIDTKKIKETINRKIEKLVSPNLHSREKKKGRPPTMER